MIVFTLGALGLSLCGCGKDSLNVAFVLDDHAVRDLKSGSVLRLETIIGARESIGSTPFYTARQMGSTVALPFDFNDHYDGITVDHISDTSGRLLNDGKGHGDIDFRGWELVDHNGHQTEFLKFTRH